MIRFGAALPQGWRGNLPTSMTPIEQYDLMRRFASGVEELGFDSIWLFDHFQPRLPVSDIHEKSFFECWTTLTSLAAATEKIRLGIHVLCNSYRFPSVLGKMASTLDVISNGRLEFGIGAGWYEEEYHAYGIPFPKPSERIHQLEEAIQIMKKMWTEEKASFAGRFYQIRDAVNVPKPVQKPHPPILIGVKGEQLGLKVAAKYADKYNYHFAPPEKYGHKLEVLKHHCKKIGRSYEDIEKTFLACVVVAKDQEEAERLARKIGEPAGGTTGNIVGSPEQVVERFQEYVELGVTYFMTDFLNIEGQMDSVKLYADRVIPALRGR